ncbi:pilus assembly protein CpaC [Paucibacter oligotrophus]|uniref:Pilus assembly protein CpaC n=1 Tax=Roseateles oligotrophus TaxID=1769250 RepID=A0A840L322_9BURK|nr:SH3 domain-containing protein [Roseateles oligotrophus]MBB4842630.1 pilus assembly protein CpaC [Roseateles oligotrophus]
MNHSTQGLGAKALAQKNLKQPLAWRRSALLGPVLLAVAELLSAQERAPAQSAGAPVTALSGDGGFGEMLQGKAARSAAKANGRGAYAPVRKQEDDGQVPEIEMFAGESRVFPAPGVARIAVGNGGLLTAAALDGKEVILFANGPGTSSLFIWHEDGRYQRLKINIVPGDTSRIAREIAAFLSAIPNARASIIGDKVIVEGERLSDTDLARIAMLEKRYPQIVNFTSSQGWEQMVMFDVKVVEFPVNALRELGLKWSAVGGMAIGGIWSPFNRGTGPYTVNVSTTTKQPISSNDPNQATVPLPSGLTILSALNMGLNAQLQALAQNGSSTVLAEPQLSTRNGSKASFLAGGEFPYSVATLQGPTIMFKSYGVKLDILPRVDRSGMIRATIDTEFSQIDGSISTPNGPALLTRKTNTEFNVRAGETIVLSGLIQRDVSNSVEKVPFLGDIPVLGALFRSTRYQNKETELVIFVTPRLVDPASVESGERIERVQQRLQERLGAAPHLSEPLQAGHDFTGSTRAPAPAPAPAVAASDDAQQGAHLQVLQEGLVLREGPSRQASPLMGLAKGAVLRLGGANLVSNEGVEWRQVRLGSKEGWVPALAVRPFVNGPVHSGGGLANTDRQGPLLGLLPPGANKAVPAGGALTLSGAGLSQLRLRVGLDRLALRVTPDVNAPALMVLPRGQQVTVLAEPARSHWTAVDVDGRRGWVASQWLQPLLSQTPAAGAPAPTR